MMQKNLPIKLTKLFKKAWKSGNGTDIGSAIAGWLNKGISWVNDNVDQFAKGAEKGLPNCLQLLSMGL